jgi:repressor LexA
MTNKQLEILEFVQSFIKTKGFAPSLQDIASGLGLKSRSNIHRHIHILARGAN